MKQFLILSLIISVMLAAEPLKVDDPAPLFFMKNLNTNTREMIDISTEMAKGNGVVLSFFASWCVPCRQELPYLQKLTDSIETVSLIAVCVDTVWAEPQKKMVADLAITKPVISDRMLIVARKYGYTGKLPYTVFIKKDGTVSAFSESFSEKEILQIRTKIIATTK